ncbi:MAG TPA: sigma-70 family RNA polymerase sigma factor [Chthonomonadaceae bacterium]|nr:sigma-70 family RNA polymerase sigma factor [Chthonomonadaceae bacterium]
MIEDGSNAGAYRRDEHLLHRYAQTGAEEAFAELMRRHMAFVYATCLRELADRSLAQDAAQVVFLVLARRAGGIRNGRALAAWLFRVAVLTARDLAKQERRRRAREQNLVREAMRQKAEATADERSLWLRPELNAALAALKGPDLECVLLHYLQGLNLRETGVAMGVSEDAVRKRVSRALLKMRRALAHGGVIVPVSVLTSVLAGTRTHALSLAQPSLYAPTSATLEANLKQMGLNRLAEGVSRTMKFAKLKRIATWAILPTLLLGGVGLIRSHADLIRPLGLLLQVAERNDMPTAPPPAPLLPGMQVPEPFTMAFEATQRAYRTPESIARMLKERRADLDRQVAAGTLSRSQADDLYRDTEAFQKSDQSVSYSRINIAGRDGKLLLSSGDTRPSYAGVLTVFDGRWSMTCETTHVGEQPLSPAGIQPNIQAGPVFWETGPELPLPGVGLSFAPLLLPLNPGQPASTALSTEAQTLDARILDPGGTAGWGRTPAAPYSPGTVRVRMVNGKPQVLQLVTPMLHVREQWDFANHVLFGGVWVARHIEIRQWIDGGLNFITTYELKDLRAEAPPLSDFSIDRWLPDLQTANFHEGNQTHPFRFRKGAGAWQDQMHRADATP